MIIKDEAGDERDVIEDKSVSVVNKHLFLAGPHKPVSYDQYRNAGHIMMTSGHVELLQQARIRLESQQAGLHGLLPHWPQ